MYTLHLGDCLDILPTLPAQSVDAIIADPPYGTTACKWDSVIPFEPMWAQLKRIIKPRGAIVLFGSQPFTSALVMSNPRWFRYEWVWRKGRPTGHLNAKKMPLNAHDNILVFSEEPHSYNAQRFKGKKTHAKTAHTSTHTDNYGKQRFDFRIVPYDDMKYPITILDFPKSGDLLHPTQKPLALMEYLVRTYTNAGNLVLDFTMGSGTTGEACINTGRDFIGIERDKGYYDIATKRLDDAAARMVQMEIAI